MGLETVIPKGTKFLLLLYVGTQVDTVKVALTLTVLRIMEKLALLVVVLDLYGAGVGFEAGNVQVGD